MKKMNFKEVGIPTIVLFCICLVVAGALAVTNELTKDKIAQNLLQTEIEARQAVLPGTEYELLSEENGVSVYAVLVSEAPAVSGTDAASDSDMYRVWTGIPSEIPVSDSDAVSDTDAVSGSDISKTDIDSITSETDMVSETDIIPEGAKYLIGYVATSGGKGYGGDVQIMVGIDLNLAVTGVRIVSHSETPGFGGNCENPDWLAQFEGMSGTLAIEKDKGEVDALSGSTITSRAVTSAINKAISQVTEIEGRLNVQ